MVLPSEGRYHLYISHDGQVQVIDHKGRIILQRGSGSSGAITTDSVADLSYIGGANLTETLNTIIDSLASPTVNTVNGEVGDVVLGSEDIDVTDFFVFSINNDIKNAVYRKGVGVQYDRVDAAAGPGDGMAKVNGDAWAVLVNSFPTYQTQFTGGAATPADVTSWTVYGGGAPLPFSATLLYSGSTQETIELVAQKVDEQSVLLYGNRYIDSHTEAIYTASTTSGNWVIYPTTDGTNGTFPIFQELLGVFPSSFNSTFPVINLQNVSMLSGSCYSMPGGSAAPNDTTVKVLMKGIRV